MCSLRISSAIWRSSVTVSVSSRTRSLGTARLSTTGVSSCRVTSCSSSEMSGAAGGGIAVGVGDRLALDPDLLALHGHGDLLGLGGHVLAQPGPAAFAGLGADPQLLLRPGHRLIDASTGRVVAGPAPAGGYADGPVDLLGVRLALGRRARLAGAVVQAVVAPQLLLFSLGQMLVGLDAWGILDQLLVVGHLDVAVALTGLDDGHEG